MKQVLSRLNILVSGVLVLLAACGTVTAAQASGALQVTITIKDYQQGTTPIGVHFATANGSTVEFVSGETVACNQVFLQYQSNPVEQLIAFGSYVGEVPHQSAGGTYTITYTPAGGSAITVPVKVITAPVSVQQPANHATVAIPKDAPLTIQYTPTQMANTTIVAVPIDSRGNWTATLPQNETGTLSVPASQFTKFQPGPGTLALARITTSSPAGTPFQQLKVEYQNITQLQIDWQ